MTIERERVEREERVNKEKMAKIIEGGKKIEDVNMELIEKEEIV